MRASRPRRLSTERIDLRQLLVGDVMISEFMSLNRGTLADEDGTFSG